MTPASLSSPVDSQRGYALMLLLAALTVAAALFALGTVSSAEGESERAKATSAALAQAKEALLGYATARRIGVNDVGNPCSGFDCARSGELPCPDTDDDGSANPPCSDATKRLGRLPRRQLGLPDLRDASGEHLWYAVSRNFINNPRLNAPLNSNTATELTLNAATEVVAVVFAPGVALSGQNGRPSNAVTDYLEGDNANGDSNYVTGPISPNLNDIALGITRVELTRAMELRVAAELRGAGNPPTSGLRSYYNDPTRHTYPWAATAASSGMPDPTQPQSGLLPYGVLSFEPTTLNSLQTNGWLSMATYTVADAFKPGTIYPQECGADGSGCLTVRGFNASQARVELGSVELAVCTTNPQVTNCP